jgi:hypothetical protein
VRSIAPSTAYLRVAAAVAVVALSPTASAGQRTQPRSTHAPLVVKIDDGGFQWGDAGIGAAAGFGGALVLTGGIALAGRRDRALNPRQQEETQI